MYTDTHTHKYTHRLTHTPIHTIRLTNLQIQTYYRNGFTGETKPS